MKKITDVKLWWNPKTSTFTKKEVTDGCFIMAKQSIEVKEELVAYFDVSGSMHGTNYDFLVEKALAMGVTKYNAFGPSLLYKDNKHLKDFCTEELLRHTKAGGTISWRFLAELPEEIIPVIFTDVEMRQGEFPTNSGAFVCIYDPHHFTSGRYLKTK